LRRNCLHLFLQSRCWEPKSWALQVVSILILQLRTLLWECSPNTSPRCWKHADLAYSRKRASCWLSYDFGSDLKVELVLGGQRWSNWCSVYKELLGWWALICWSSTLAFNQEADPCWELEFEDFVFQDLCWRAGQTFWYPSHQYCWTILESVLSFPFDHALVHSFLVVHSDMTIGSSSTSRRQSFYWWRWICLIILESVALLVGNWAAVERIIIGILIIHLHLHISCPDLHILSHCIRLSPTRSTTHRSQWIASSILAGWVDFINLLLS